MAYPAFYVALTLPLAAGRLAAMTGTTLSPVYYSIAGSMMASCGFIDVILYVTTRKALVGTHGAAEKRKNNRPATGFVGTFKSLFVNEGSPEQLRDERGFDMNTFGGALRSDSEAGKAEKVMGMGWGGIKVERRISLSKEDAEDDKQLDLERVSSERRLVPEEGNRAASRTGQATASSAPGPRRTGSWGLSASASPSITGEPGKTWEAVA